MKSLQTPPTQVSVLGNGTTLTADGLTRKGTYAVEIINVRSKNRAGCLFYSWRAYCLLRSDFNFVGAEMYNGERRADYWEQALGLVQEVRVQAEMLLIDRQSFSLPPVLGGSAVPLRLFSPNVASLFRTFQIADSAYARQNNGMKLRLLAENLVHSCTHLFEAAFSDLKIWYSTHNSKTSQRPKWPKREVSLDV